MIPLFKKIKITSQYQHFVYFHLCVGGIRGGGGESRDRLAVWLVCRTQGLYWDKGRGQRLVIGWSVSTQAISIAPIYTRALPCNFPCNVPRNVPCNVPYNVTFTRAVHVRICLLYARRVCPCTYVLSLNIPISISKHPYINLHKYINLQVYQSTNNYINLHNYISLQI